MNCSTVSSTFSSLTQSQKKLLQWLPLWHLGLSALLALGLALLVYGFWFPTPHHQMGGGMRLFWWMLGVDVVCGPLLTWLLIRPGKSVRALAVDASLIACLQLGALIYGVHTLSHARPLAVVFEVDRFRVISHADVPEDELSQAIGGEWFTPWNLQPPRVIGLTKLQTQGLEAKAASVQAALQGVDAAQRPVRWQDYALSRADVLERARPLEALRARYPLDTALIDAAVERAVGNRNAPLLWLPLVGRRTADWVVLIDPTTAALVSYIPLDGFF